MGQVVAASDEGIGLNAGPIIDPIPKERISL